ncbi:protein-disulfide reductase DsbD family protein [Pseudopontixanthobacter vadosimaris]|uniref:protein-disulfide reductase DsbD family protein n=1 Tax=Pseudopontixanthobacter vadosimaris TaxID=2726450 RepID=UPI0030B90EB6
MFDARIMPRPDAPRRSPAGLIAGLLLLLALALMPVPAAAQIAGAPPQGNNIAARLVADGPARAGQQITLAIAFDPKPGWHGYWKNPGDAGYGLALDWELPAGWQPGELLYPVPETLLIAGLMNHVYEGPHAVLVPLEVPATYDTDGPVQIAVDARWLACTDKICVPESARLTLSLPVAANGGDARFDRWRALLPPLIDRTAQFETAGDTLRIAIPLPASLSLAGPHLFIEQTRLVNYAATQQFARAGDWLVGEIALSASPEVPQRINGILALGEGEGIRFSAVPGPVPDGGQALAASGETPAYWLLILGALAGGLLLNGMPCVFPILSLKALSLARAGRSEAEARVEGLSYSAGVLLACLGLGGLLLALRAAGQQVGWAFQLQQPGVVVALLVLAGAITANLAGLYALPSFRLSRSGRPLNSFATGLLAAFVATPCTGPFMAAALGAALLLPPIAALLLFGALGLGLALPFLLIGFVPALRRRLPKPGAWMERFRRLMAIPMGLTALALVWLCWRLGGALFALEAVVLVMAAVALLALWSAGYRPARNRGGFAIAFATLTAIAALGTMTAFYAPAARATGGMLNAQPFSEARLAEARASGAPVFVWFTADWCVTCKVNEQVAIERAETQAAFAQAGVVSMVGDWTRGDPAIGRFLDQQGAAGVPLYLWYESGGAAEHLPQVLGPQSLVTLAERPR